MSESKQPENGLTRRRFLMTSAGAVIAAGSLSSVPLRAGSLEANAANQAAATVYVCPPCGAPCDKLIFDKPGTCPQCGMELVPRGGGDGGPPVVAILLFDAAEIIDFAGPWEVFGTAGFLVHTVAEKTEPLTMVFGQKVVPDFTFENSPKADILLVPGGGVWSGPIGNARLIQWIQTKSKDVSQVMSVCTGAFLLEKAGLLAQQTVTATYGMIEDLASPQTKVVYDQRFVDNGKIITTAGLSSGIDGALHVVSKILGKGKAQSVALSMEYHWEPDSHYARASMADKYLPDGLAYGKAKIKGAEATMISTGGDPDHWEIKILVSKPQSSAEIIDLMRERIGSNTGAAGMFRPISHIRGAVSLSPSRTKESEFKWKFTDDLSRAWQGECIAAASTAEKGKFDVTLRLMRSL